MNLELKQLQSIKKDLSEVLYNRLNKLKPIDVIPTVNDAEKIYKMYSEIVSIKPEKEYLMSMLVDLSQSYPKDIKYEDKFSTILSCFYDISDAERRIAKAFALVHQEVSSLAKFIELKPDTL